tara:strand:- start:76 stop:324 length:249 start_codon:yes stop_codon:yes gene_type:complete
MAKYKKINENVLLKFVDSLFGAIGRGMRSKAIEKVSKQDPVLGAHIKKLDRDADALLKHLRDQNKRKFSKAELDAVAKTWEK